MQTNIHKGLGSVGAVTNGSFRDLKDSARGYNLLGAKVGPSHAFVHVVDVACQVTVFGLTVTPNDIVHADHHGAVMIPAEAVVQIPDVVAQLVRREKVILDAAKAPGFNIDKLKAAMQGAKEIH